MAAARHFLADLNFRHSPQNGRAESGICQTRAWIEDFRKDIARNDLPTMIIHGDDARILPADATSRRQAKTIKNVKYVEINGGSHGIPWTRAEEINAELVRFLA
jgi:non-heme chloroperoxidase